MVSGGFLSSVGALSAARAMAMASQILVLPILARHLKPEEFGIVALATGVVAFVNLFSDAGMARSLIRTPLEKADEWSSAFWFLVVLGLVLAALFLALAHPMAWFFDEPALLNPLLALAALPAMLALNAPFAAEMEQRRAFAELALSQAAATAIALAAAVWLAILEFGVWALVAQQLLLIGVRAIWVAARSQFRPRLVFSRDTLGPHFTFGRDITAASIIGFISLQSTTLAIGKVLGTADLGLFAMTQRFARLPMFGLAGPFGQVLYVRLTRATQDEAEFRKIVLSAIRTLAFAALPAMAAVAAVSETAFTIILSDRWAPVAPIFVMIAGGAALQAAIHPTTIALAALGLTGRRLRLIVEITVFWLLLLSATLSFGVVAIAAAHTFWMVLQLPRHWRYLDDACGLGARPFLTALIPGAVVAGVMVAAITAAATAAPPDDWRRLLFVGGAAALVFGIAVLIFFPYLKKDLARLHD